MISIIKPKLAHRKRLNKIVSRISADGHLAESFLDGAAHKLVHYVEDLEKQVESKVQNAINHHQEMIEQEQQEARLREQG
eukprot:SAG31_NODE_24191_length_487_cov_0.657216_1_plen_79_part_01